MVNILKYLKHLCKIELKNCFKVSFSCLVSCSNRISPADAFLYQVSINNGIVIFSLYSRWSCPKSFSTFCVFSIPTLMVNRRLCLPSHPSRVLVGVTPMLSSRKPTLTWLKELVNCQKKRLVRAQNSVIVQMYIFKYFLS